MVGRPLLIWDAVAGCAHIPVVPALGYGACAGGRTDEMLCGWGSKVGLGSHGVALEVGLSTLGHGVRMKHCGHRQEHSPAQGTYMAMHLPCSAPGTRESKQHLTQKIMLKKIPQTLTAPFSLEGSAQHYCLNQHPAWVPLPQSLQGREEMTRAGIQLSNWEPKDGGEPIC